MEPTAAMQLAGVHEPQLMRECSHRGRVALILRSRSVIWVLQADDLLADPASGVEQRATGQGISMIRDVFGIRALQHHDARVMLNGDNANRRVRQELAHDAGVPQRIDRHEGWIEPGSCHRARKRMPVIAVPPGRTTRPRQ
jgi:hypothetical protein